MPKAYVARRYDVKFQSWLHGIEWDKVRETWEQLYEKYIDSDCWEAVDNDDDNSYEIKKADARRLLEKLKTFTETRDGWLLAPGEASPVCRAVMRDYLEELLLISKHVPGFIRVEVR